MIIEVEDISFREYVGMNAADKIKINFYLTNGKFEPVDLFGFGSFLEQTFEFVKDWQEILRSEDGLSWKIFMDEIEKITKIDATILAKKSIFDLQKCRYFILKEVNQINEIESIALNHAHSAREQSAGLEIFANYKSFLQFDSLADGDLTRFKEVGNLPYSLCLTKLKLEKDRAEYSERFSKLK